MKAKDVMTRKVLSIEPDATVLQAARKLLQNRISGLPVINSDGVLVGIVSEGDFLRRGEAGTERRRPGWLEFFLGPGRLASDYAHSHGRTVAEVMTDWVYTVEEDVPLDDVVKLMERHRIKRVPVVRGDKVVGIVTRANLLRALVSLSHVAPPAVDDDATIREALIAELDKQGWKPPMVDVVVHQGVVALWGAIMDERQRAAMKIAAENIPGVKGVEDHMVWIEPLSGAVIEPPGTSHAA
ncbi:MAG TPA: CBS domain-containing protein [Pseudolabrys sp.]|nr:CBS domain-containing protein [Pseudolabrys sp.]